ncbi:efflux RND transporter periplasmic adaptor subunit [Mesorhizobium neociceri]|uniref:Efflux RND transporter periplasmic adaptor subunit n=1 Tax=Mesorhizobium neociceri TaxID=1307853 RepID=A0A838B377_9HYPH|nr:efflux RND transporter periplasmic adaptor subunit [Mesorhizobium neociceri]MBA1140329.1 efflux RND transporter periplasmic adaptor subunit [Mesorhizobium neociceri]
MSRTSAFFVLAVIAAGTGAGGYWVGHQGLDASTAMPTLQALAARLTGQEPQAMAADVPQETVIYYRHPDGKPAYSAVPRKAPDGHDFVAVRASKDVSFAPQATPSVEVTPAQTTTAAESGVRKILYYRNPMGLPDTSTTPKKDSMGMDYIPVFEGEADDGATVKVSTGKLQRTGVKTVLAAMGQVVRPVHVPGTVQLDERRISVISTRTEAFIEDVADVTAGEVVAEGKPLVGLYAREITSAGAAYAVNLKSGAAADGAVQRLKNLGVPAETIDTIRKTGKVPLSVTLTAPRGGVILERMAVDGMMASAGQTLFRIADISSMWVMADVPEYELSSIRVGAVATIQIRSLPGREFAGRVDLIYPEIAMQTRTARVRIQLPNPDRVLLANMYADVDIATGDGKAVVTVPDSAVIDTGDRQVVIVDKGDGAFEPRDVKIGMRGDGMAEIMTGIAAGDRVVVSANFLIDAESNLRAALSGLTPAEAKP